MISFFAFAAFLNFVVSFFLGIFVYFVRPKHDKGKFFILYFWAVALWSFGYYMWQIADNAGSALFWCRFLMSGAIFIPVFYFNFILDFLSKHIRKKNQLYFFYVLAFIFSLINLTDFFVKNVENKLNFIYWPNAGVLYLPFLIYFLTIVCYGWYLLLTAFKKEKDRVNRQQIKYFLLGTGIGFFGGLTNYPLWYDIPILPYGNILVTFGVIFVAIALFKYRLFETRVILTEFLVGMMGLVLIFLPFLMPTAGLKILTSLVFTLFCFFGYYLIRAVHRESRRREDAETIASRERILRREAEVLAADLRRLDRAKTQFLLSTQHHLRSPLSVINGYLSMINEESYGKITKKSKEKVGACLEANKKLIRLVDELLDVAHFQMNNSAAEKEPVDAVALAAQIVADLAPAAEAKNLYLKFKKTEVPIPEIMLNPRGIKEALYNIVDNAIKYTQTGGVIVLVSVFGEKLRIEIKDTGIGLNEKDREGIFGRVFERCERAKGANVEGKGIGLYLAAQIIANNGGKISVESEGWGKGSKFIIDLPMEDCDSGVKS